MHMIAYNLVRAAAMAGSATAKANANAKKRGAVATLDRISYKGTADRIATWSTAIWSAPTGKNAAEMVAHMH